MEGGRRLRMIARSPLAAKAKTTSASTRVATVYGSQDNVLSPLSPVSCLLSDVHNASWPQPSLAPLATNRRLVDFGRARRNAVGVFGHGYIRPCAWHGILPTNLRAAVVFLLRAAAIAHSNDRRAARGPDGRHGKTRH